MKKNILYKFRNSLYSRYDTQKVCLHRLKSAESSMNSVKIPVKILHAIKRGTCIWTNCEARYLPAFLIGLIRIRSE